MVIFSEQKDNISKRLVIKYLNVFTMFVCTA